MALMEISIVPLGTKQVSLSDYVARAARVAGDSGLEFRLHDMGTTVRGDLHQLLELAERMHEAVFGPDVMRVYTVIKIDDRRDKDTGFGEKTKSVMHKL